MKHQSGTSARTTVHLDSATDAQVWQVASHEDPEAFGAIFDRHVDAVHRYCARRAGSADAADDLVSVVFLEAWRLRGEVVLQRDSALPWLLGVARHTLAHRARSRMRHHKALDRLPRTSVPDHADSVVAKLDDRRRLAGRGQGRYADDRQEPGLSAIERAFAQLNDKEQDVIAVCVWQGLEYADAALTLGVPVGTVRSRLSRARARLATLTEQQQSHRRPRPGSKDA